MTIMTIEDKLKNIVADQLGVRREAITTDATFESLGGDSLDKINIVMACEEEFAIEIPDEDGEKLTTAREAISYIKARKAA